MEPTPIDSLQNENHSKADLSMKITPDFDQMISIIFWNSLGFFFFIFLIPYVTAQLLEASGTEMGLTFASQLFGGLLSAPLVSYLTDRVSKKLLVLIGSFGRGASYIIMFIGIIFSSLIVFAISLFVLGFFVGIFWSPLDTLIAEKSFKRNRSYAFGKRGGMIGRGNLVGSIISFALFGLAIVFTPDNLFLVYSPLIFFALSNVYAGIKFQRTVDESLTFDKHVSATHTIVPSYYLEPEAISQNNSNSKGTITAVFIVGFIVLMVAFLTVNMNQSLAQPFFQVYLIDVLGVENPVIVMIIYFPSQILAPLIGPKMGKISDKINPLLGVTCVSSLGALVTFFLISSNSGLLFAILLTFDSILAWGGMIILRNLLSRVSKHHRGKVFGITQWTSQVGAIIGPIVGGLAWDYLGPRSPFIISIFVELSVIALFAVSIAVLKPFMAEKLD